MDIGLEHRKMSLFKLSLVSRLTLSMWLFSALACVFTVFLATFLILRQADEEDMSRIRSEVANIQAMGIVDLISENGFQELIPRLPAQLQKDRLSEIIRIYDPSGGLLYTNVQVPELERVHFSRARFVNRGFFVIPTETREYLAQLRSYRTLDGDILWVEVATPRTGFVATLRLVMWPFLAFFTILLALGFIMARLLTKRVLRPVHELAQDLDGFDVNRFKSWKPLVGRTQVVEFRPIVSKFNELLGRIQNAFMNLQNVAQFVSHEIRTPLTIMRGEIETSLAGGSENEREYALRSALEEVGRMEEIVHTVLRLSQSQTKALSVQIELIDLPAVAQKIAMSLSKLYQRKIEVDVPQDLKNVPRILTDPELFELLLGNLVRNICRHTPQEVEGRISFERTSDGWTCVRVKDEGPGVSDEILRAMNEEGGGSEALGVGLTLVKQIARVLRLKIQFENRGGLEVRIWASVASDLTKSPET